MKSQIPSSGWIGMKFKGMDVGGGMILEQRGLVGIGIVYQIQVLWTAQGQDWEALALRGIKSICFRQFCWQSGRAGASVSLMIVLRE